MLSANYKRDCMLQRLVQEDNDHYLFFERAFIARILPHLALCITYHLQPSALITSIMIILGQMAMMITI